MYRHVRFPYKIRDDMEMPALSIHRVGVNLSLSTTQHPIGILPEFMINSVSVGKSVVKAMRSESS